MQFFCVFCVFFLRALAYVRKKQYLCTAFQKWGAGSLKMCKDKGRGLGFRSVHPWRQKQKGDDAGDLGAKDRCGQIVTRWAFVLRITLGVKSAAGVVHIIARYKMAQKTKKQYKRAGLGCPVRHKKKTPTGQSNLFLLTH